MAMSVEYVLKELGQALLVSQDNASQLAQIRATIFVHYGPSSISLPRLGFQLDEESFQSKLSTIEALVFVLNALEGGNK